MTDSGTPATVLLVDDSHKNRRLARMALGKVGYKVITAADGFDALSKIVSHGPSVVFIQSILPRLDGYQTCALIKNNADYCNIHVVLLFGGSHPVDNTRAQLVGCDLQLFKPLTDQSLLAAVEHKNHGARTHSIGIAAGKSDSV